MTVECSDYLKRRRVEDVLDLREKLQRGRCVLASHVIRAHLLARALSARARKE
jgi:hypothetical protein